ncbi:MAG: NAD(P)(+) transhydrogenase (Re/Si-specific) subunit beta [Acidimicrobiales bacterium]
MNALAVAVGPAGLTGTYLVSAICFIVALKALSSPKRARYGNLIGVAGMVVAIGITLADAEAGPGGIIPIGMAIGAVIAIPVARMVKMTAMPQMVAIFNGVGGGAAATISAVELLRELPGHPSSLKVLEIVFGLVIGCLSFAGSLVAFSKLQGWLTGRPIRYPLQQPSNAFLVLVVVGLGMFMIWDPHLAPFGILVLVALLLGAASCLPIGGADTPVLISLLNSFTGLAVAADGFVLDNVILIVAGTLVGASGALLTKMMSDAMGRSLPNIVLGGLKTAGSTEIAGGDAAAQNVRSADATDIGTLLAYSQRVIIVPGYGLAVAQAQRTAAELAKALEDRGVEVAYDIHPVAGRMPGHMNVLLAEADVPYERLDEMDVANTKFPSTDVALVVGANDVVNPAARDSPGSPLYGMPILNADQAQHVVFLKRSMRPGFAGIDNSLLHDPKTVLLFGDAKDSLTKLVAAVKSA